ncbi:hypothetical protein [Aliamphritea spongicola]|uniref:hypothetical protein n=1 Tax=Aliamphritea spongicola TaxID=707589 RepID=UPI00196B776A|nr:hypothetical protein [Aliamphritea spongicola]MBN3563892.1 hypothetical protein [Aliamphritea spongicola]
MAKNPASLALAMRFKTGNKTKLLIKKQIVINNKKKAETQQWGENNRRIRGYPLIFYNRKDNSRSTFFN